MYARPTSETTVLVANYRSMPVRPGSMGKPVPGWDVEVLDESGQPAANEVVGNIAVRETVSGKIRRSELRERLRAGAGAGS